MKNSPMPFQLNRMTDVLRRWVLNCFNLHALRSHDFFLSVLKRRNFSKLREPRADVVVLVLNVWKHWQHWNDSVKHEWLASKRTCNRGGQTQNWVKSWPDRDVCCSQPFLKNTINTDVDVFRLRYLSDAPLRHTSTKKYFFPSFSLK